MRPVVSPPISMPSYSRCAIRMVCAGAKPSLRLASCCSVEVVKGACGLRRAGLASTGGDVKVAASDHFFGVLAVADVEPLDLLAVGADQPRLKTIAARRRQRCHQRPVFAGHEFFDFE